MDGDEPGAARRPGAGLDPLGAVDDREGPRLADRQGAAWHNWRLPERAARKARAGGGLVEDNRVQLLARSRAAVHASYR